MIACPSFDTLWEGGRRVEASVPYATRDSHQVHAPFLPVPLLSFTEEKMFAPSRNRRLVSIAECSGCADSRECVAGQCGQFTTGGYRSVPRSSRFASTHVFEFERAPWYAFHYPRSSAQASLLQVTIATSESGLVSFQPYRATKSASAQTHRALVDTAWFFASNSCKLDEEMRPTRSPTIRAIQLVTPKRVSADPENWRASWHSFSIIRGGNVIV